MLSNGVVAVATQGEAFFGVSIDAPQRSPSLNRMGPTCLHPLAEQYLDRCVPTTSAVVSSKPRKQKNTRHRPQPQVHFVSAPTEAIAEALGCTADAQFTAQSHQRMGTLKQSTADPATPKGTEAPSAGENDQHGSTHLPRGFTLTRTIQAVPDASACNQALLRYIGHYSETFGALPRPNGGSATSTTDAVSVAESVSTLVHALDTELCSISRFGVDYATYKTRQLKDSTGEGKEANRTAEVFSLRGGAHMRKRRAQAPEPGGWDAVAAAKHMVNILTGPALRVMLQKVAWPTTASLHRSILRKVDLLCSLEKDDDDRSMDVQQFLYRAGYDGSVERLKEDLFSFPQDVFTLMTPGPQADGVYLPPADARRVRNSTRVFEVVVLPRSLTDYCTFRVASPPLSAAMGSTPPTDKILAFAEGLYNSSTLQHVRPKGKEGKLSDSLWLLLTEMSLLRMLTACLLSVELLRENAKEVSLLTSSESRRDGAEAAVGVAETLLHSNQMFPSYHVRNIVTKFANRARIISADETPEASRNVVIGAMPLPKRYASVTEVYNTFATAVKLHAGTHKPSRSGGIAAPAQHGSHVSSPFTYQVVPSQGVGVDDSTEVVLSMTRGSLSVDWPISLTSDAIKSDGPPLLVATSQAASTDTTAARLQQWVRAASWTPVRCNGKVITSIPLAHKALKGALKVQLVLRRL